MATRWEAIRGRIRKRKLGSDTKKDTTVPVTILKPLRLTRKTTLDIRQSTLVRVPRMTLFFIVAFLAVSFILIGLFLWLLRVVFRVSRKGFRIVTGTLVFFLVSLPSFLFLSLYSD